MKLHLGCGKQYLNGYINCDISRHVRTDKIVDLEKKLPFEDASIKEIIITHTLEHIENFNELMIEMHRICKHNTIIKIRVPFYTHFGAFMDPTHKRFFTPFTFDYFSNSPYGYEVVKEPLFNIKNVRLKFLFRKSFINTLINPMINLNHKVYCRFFAQIFPAAEIYFELSTIKKES